MPVASWPICCASPALVPRSGHHTAQHTQAQPQPRQPPTSFSLRQKPSKGSAICFTATQGRWSEPQNNNETRKTQLTCRSFCCSPSSAFSASSCPAATWHFRLRLCPHAPSLLLTHTAQNTGAGENEPTTSQVPSYDVRTRTHLAGGRRPAYFIHARDDERTSFTAAEARPARRGTGSRRVNERHHHPARAPAATSQRRAPTTELRGCLRAREASCSRPQMPSGITP